MKKTILPLLCAAVIFYSCSESELVTGNSTVALDRQGNTQLATAAASYVPEELYIAKGWQLFAIDQNTGAGYTYVSDNAEMPVMASTGGYIYTVNYGNMLKINPTAYPIPDPGTPPFGTGWGGTEAMTALGSYVYAVQGGTLWRVNAGDGATIPFSDYPNGWDGTEAMTAIGSYLYAVQGGTLWRVNLSNGDVEPFSDYPTGWDGTEAMTAYGSYIYAVQGGTLWSVNVNNGDVTPFSNYPTGWDGTLAITARDGHLYAVQGSSLWKVNISTESVAQLGNGAWDRTTSMTALR
jgi:hypothetical protein